MSRVASAATKAGGRSASVSKTAWIPEDGMEHADWIMAGRRLGAIGRCSQWWVGDWIRYGNAKWGEKYVEAARVTGYDVASLRNMAWVASRFDLSLRSDTLTWSHHVLLAPLGVDEQRYWLERASEKRFSVADLRIELKGRRTKAERTDSAESAAGEPCAMVCPKCGHTMVEATA